jgi:Ca2+/Na+ antiporter
MKRPSPSQSRLYQHVYVILLAVWTAWSLRGTEGLKFIVDVILLLLVPVLVVVVEVQYRRQRNRPTSVRVDPPQ